MKLCFISRILIVLIFNLTFYFFYSSYFLFRNSKGTKCLQIPLHLEIPVHFCSICLQAAAAPHRLFIWLTLSLCINLTPKMFPDNLSHSPGESGTLHPCLCCQSSSGSRAAGAAWPLLPPPGSTPRLHLPRPSRWWTHRLMLQHSPVSITLPISFHLPSTPPCPHLSWRHEALASLPAEVHSLFFPHRSKQRSLLLLYKRRSAADDETSEMKKLPSAPPMEGIESVTEQWQRVW